MPRRSPGLALESALPSFFESGANIPRDAGVVFRDHWDRAAEVLIDEAKLSVERLSNLRGVARRLEHRN